MRLYLKLTNEAAERIFIDTVRVLDNEGYHVDFFPFTLYRGQTDSIAVLYAPDKPMKSNSFLRICFTSNSKLFMDIPVRGSTPVPELTVDPEPVKFGELEPYTQESRFVSISNTGSADLSISEMVVEYRVGNFVFPTDFSLVDENCSILAPGASCQAEISFYPRKTGYQASYLIISSNDPDEPYKRISITGNAQYPRAQISVNPYRLEYGYVAINDTVTDTLSINNTGEAELIISNITLSGTNADQFTFNSSCSNILPGESCQMTVDFTPAISGDCSATLKIYSNSQYNNPYSVSLSGSSARKELSASDPALDFGQKLIGEDSMAVITYTNDGDYNVTISEISILGRDMYEFLHTGWNGILAPGESCNDTIWFAPIFPGEKNAYISVVSDDTDEPVMEIPLTGTAGEGAAPLQVAVNAIPETGLVPLEVQFSATPFGGSPPYTYFWDFKDQTNSTLQNPVHIFNAVNTYEIHLTVEDSEGKTAEDYVTITVADELYNLSGAILNEEGSSGITRGVVQLLEDGSAMPEDEYILEGSNDYIFTDLAEGEYTLRCLPDLDSFPDALPTYLGNVLMLYEATFITLDKDTANQDILVQNTPGTGSGEGNISGNLVEGEGGIKTTLKEVYSAAGGTPMEGVYVYLFNNGDGSLAGSAMTDQDGYFEFPGLPATSYEFVVDYMGIPMDESNPLLTITEQDDSIAIVATVSAMQISTEILVTGIHDFLTPEGIVLYPNPAKDILYLKADKEIIKEGLNRIFLVGVNGNIVTSEYFYHSGAEETEISIGHVPAGIYLLRFEGKNGFYNIRLVIMK
jgi:PKD repeat protein